MIDRGSEVNIVLKPLQQHFARLVSKYYKYILMASGVAYECINVLLLLHILYSDTWPSGYCAEGRGVKTPNDVYRFGESAAV